MKKWVDFCMQDVNDACDKIIVNLFSSNNQFSLCICMDVMAGHFAFISNHFRDTRRHQSYISFPGSSSSSSISIQL